jgi:DNA gyrase subunit A
MTRLNKDKLSDEKKSLKDLIDKLQNLMDSDTAVRTSMVEEFIELKSKFGIPRRFRILTEEGELEDIDLVQNSRNVIVVTRGGYIKRMRNAWEERNFQWFY